eukprot:835746-Karenia_brevis.AAC.1
MASRARGLLKNPDGSWKVLKVQGQVLYVKPDSPPNVRKVNGATSKLDTALRTIHPGIKTHVEKGRFHPQRPPRGIISIGSEDLAVITAASPYEPADVLWDMEVVARHSIDKAKVLENYEYTSRSSARQIDTTAWCK